MIKAALVCIIPPGVPCSSFRCSSAYFLALPLFLPGFVNHYIKKFKTKLTQPWSAVYIGRSQADFVPLIGTTKDLVSLLIEQRTGNDPFFFRHIHD